jgi:hypothetical protein
VFASLTSRQCELLLYLLHEDDEGLFTVLFDAWRHLLHQASLRRVMLFNAQNLILIDCAVFSLIDMLLINFLVYFSSGISLSFFMLAFLDVDADYDASTVLFYFLIHMNVTFMHEQ